MVSLLQCLALPGFYYSGPGVPPAVICPFDMVCAGYGTITPTPCPPDRPYARQGSKTSTASDCTAAVMAPCVGRAGFFLASTSTGGNNTAEECSPCPAGAFCPGDQSIVLCDPLVNFSSPPLSSTQAACTPPSSSMISSPSSSGVSGGGITCPANTQLPVNQLGYSLQRVGYSLLQCRAEAGYAFIPNQIGPALKCPPNFYCPAGTPLPVPCSSSLSPTPAAVPCGLGFFPTNAPPCNIAGLSAPQPSCQACVSTLASSGLVFTTPGACTTCCGPDMYYTTGSNICRPMPDSYSTCPDSQYVPHTPACATSLPACTQCPPPPNPTLDFAQRPSSSSTTTSSSSQPPSYYGPESCVYACAAGYYFSDRYGNCTPCAPGTAKGLVSSSMSCTPCPPLYAASAPGQTACTPCPQHSVQGGSTCSCMSGTYLSLSPSAASSGTGASLMMQCISCPTGFYSAQGQASCTACPPGNVCVVLGSPYAPTTPAAVQLL